MELKENIEHLYFIIGKFALKLHGFDVQPDCIQILLGVNPEHHNFEEQIQKIKIIEPQLNLPHELIFFDNMKYDYNDEFFMNIYNNHCFDTHYGKIASIPILLKENLNENIIKDNILTNNIKNNISLSLDKEFITEKRFL